MPLIVSQSQAWTRKKAVLYGCLVAVIAIVVAQLSDQFIFFVAGLWTYLILLAVAFVLWPSAALALAYRRLPRAQEAALCSCAFGTCLSLAWLVGEVSFSTFDLSLVHIGLHLGVFAVAILLPMGVWLACRCIRGPVLIQTGSLCSQCGYNLTGNVSGVCPECGTEIPAQEISDG